jgi:hypothetical protein
LQPTPRAAAGSPNSHNKAKLPTLRLSASLILKDLDAAVRTILGYLEYGGS